MYHLGLCFASYIIHQPHLCCVCRDSGAETILWLAHQPDVSMAGMLAAFTRPVKNQNAWRPVYGRLQLITSLVPLFGVSKGGEGGFQLEPLMKFVGSAFTSANAEVRSQAVKVTLLLYSKVCHDQLL